uniref:Uncharacterized protein n=1 Tax=Arundo donax TaxID=35708 RepID=A0A0A9C8X2_ARUDO
MLYFRQMVSLFIYFLLAGRQMVSWQLLARNH